MDEYSEAHINILLAISQKGVLTNIEVIQILDNSPQFSQLGKNEIKDVIARINKEISIFEKKIIFVKNEINGSEELVYISLCDDEISRCQKYYSKSDLEYFKWVLEDLLISESKTISGISAVNLVSKVQTKNMSKVEAQKLLDEWSRMYYFKKEATGNYSLNTRGIHEFETYFTKLYPTYIDVCDLCKKNVFTSSSCSSCGEKYHIYCLNKYLRKINKCPNCKEVIEENISQSSSQLAPSQSDDFCL